MDSITYLNERDMALVRKISDNEASDYAAALYQDKQVKQLVNSLRVPLSEMVRLYVGVNCRRPSDINHFVNFLKSLCFLKSEVEKEDMLCAFYQGNVKVNQGTPVQVAIEVSSIILLAIATGAATEIGKELVKIFLSKWRTNKRSKALLLDMLLGSPIPSLLAQESSGLTVDELYAKTCLSKGEVCKLLKRYEERGWLEREKTSGKEIWLLQRNNIDRFFGI
ncbi:MAG: MarR family transcriptional regulator [Candidatus Hodarchaeota archaeon]